MTPGNTYTPSDQRAPGFYRVRLVKSGPWVAARLMESEGLWLLLLNGVPTSAAVVADYYRVPRIDKMAYAREIPEAEYRAILAAYADAAPGTPLADPSQPIDLRNSKSFY